MAATLVVGRVAIRVFPDTSKFREELRGKLEKETANLDAEVPVEAELTGEEKVREDLRAMVKELSNKFVVEINTQLENIAAKMKALTKKAEAQSKADPIDLAVTLNEDALRGMRSGIRRSIADVVQRDIRKALLAGFHIDRDALKQFSKDVQDGVRKDPLVMEIKADRRQWDKHVTDLIARTKGQIDKADLGRVLHRKFADGIEYEVRLVPDFKQREGLLAYARNLSRDINRTFARTIRHPFASIKNASLKTEDFFDGWDDELPKLLREVRDRVVLEVKTKPDLLSVLKTRAELEAAFARFADLRQGVKVVLDQKSFQATVTALTALSGGRVLKKLISLEPFKNLDTDLPKIALMATLFGMITNYIISMSSDMLALGRSLSQIIPAAITLPGILMGAAAAAYAIISPMTEFGDKLPEIKKKLIGMRAEMSKAFWGEGLKGLRTWNELIDIMVVGMTKASRAAGSFMGKLAASMTKYMKPSFGKFFDSVAESFQILSKAARPIGRILRNFMDLGSIYMPRLAGATERVLGVFDKWLNRNIESGDIFEWIETGITRLVELREVVRGALGVLDGFSMAAEAAGGLNLKRLGDALKNIAALSKQKGFQEGLVNVFHSARVAIERMVKGAGPAVSKLFKDIGASAHLLLPVIGDVAGDLVRMLATILNHPALGSGLISFFQGIRVALREVEPHVGALGSGLGGILRLLGSMAQSFAPIIVQGLEIFEAHAGGLLGAVERMVSNLTTGFSSFLTSITPGVQIVATAAIAIAESLSTGISGLLQGAGPAINVLLTMVGRVLEGFSKMPRVLQLAVAGFITFTTLAKRWPAVLAPLITRVRNIGTAFSSIPMHVNGTSTTLGKFTAGIKRHISKLSLLALAVGGLVSSMQGAAAGSEQWTTSMQKASTGDFSWLDQIASKMNGIFGIDGAIYGQINNVSDALAQLKANGEGWHDFGGGLLDFAASLVGSGPVSQIGQLKQMFKDLDSQLASMAQAAPDQAKALYDQLIAKGQAAGWTTEQLSEVFKEYSSVVERQGTEAAATWRQSTEDVIQASKEMSDKINSRMELLERQAGVLEGKAKRRVLTTLTETRAGALEQMGLFATGTNAKVVEAAEKLNGQLVGALENTKGKTGKAAKAAWAEVDRLEGEWERSFGNMNSVVGKNLDEIPGIFATVIDKTRGTIDAEKLNELLSPYLSKDAKKAKEQIKGIEEYIKKMDLKPAGKSLMDAFSEGLKERTAKAIATAVAAMTAIRRVFPSSPAKDPRSPFAGKGFTDLGKAIMPQFAAGITGSASDAVSAAHVAMRGVQSSLGLDVSVGNTGRIAKALDQAGSVETEAPIQIGELKIGPDDPDYGVMSEAARRLRRRVRAGAITAATA